MRYLRFWQSAVDPQLARLHTAISERREALVTQVEIDLLIQHDLDVVAAQRLNQCLKDLTDDVNRRVLTVLSCYPNLAEGGRWHRRAVFQAPRLVKLPSVGNKRRVLIADIDGRIRRAHALLDQLWHNQDWKRRFSTQSSTAVVDELMVPVLGSIAEKEAA